MTSPNTTDDTPMTALNMMLSTLIRSTSRARPLTVSTKKLYSFVPFSTVDASNHKLNCSKALKKADESHCFSDLAVDHVEILQGIGPTRLEALHGLGIKTLPDLANYKFYHIAKAIVVLADTEEARPDDSTMNINKALDKSHEIMSFRELVDEPVSALQGISNTKAAHLHELGVTTIGDLAKLKYSKWAESIVYLSQFEEMDK